MVSRLGACSVLLGLALGCLSYVVERTAGHAKRGSPASWIWQNAFSEIYLYDLYVGLGMQDLADSTWDELEPTHHDYPFPPSYWFADYYYPVWRDHGENAGAGEILRATPGALPGKR